MVFSKFISIVFGILGSYYFIIILFDMLQSNSKVAQVTTHAIQFDTSEKPVMISDEAEKSLQPVNPLTQGILKNYLPQEDSLRIRKLKANSPIIDLGLETLSGGAYTVDAENLSKFMIA